MKTLQITLFGHVRGIHPQATEPLKLSRGTQAFFAYLLLQQHPVPRDMLMDVFLEDHSPDRARGSLTTALWRLRHVPEPESDEQRAQLSRDIEAAKKDLTEHRERYDGLTDKDQRAIYRAQMSVFRKKVARLERWLDAAEAGPCDASVLSLSISDARMQAQVKSEAPSTDPYITAPDSKYRGAENQLYCVEIHNYRGGRHGKDHELVVQVVSR